ncbi:hypothetical protein Y032_0368g66 [Ancylostoma ceylanicum]|uniref:Uncharacterized protein n=1 Tax=Ancylostoma ceylanicum TaxID=53326 RepID=A0A016RUM1_9BILA|nr:hypothetical protein Y032_0368g66 [Ancylostoma ceylanicum]
MDHMVITHFGCISSLFPAIFLALEISRPWFESEELYALFTACQSEKFFSSLQMSQENTNMSAPSRMGDRSPETAGFIDWYDSPKVLFPTQSKQLRRSVQLMKTRSAEEFSPHRSFLDETASTSDLDSIWCANSPADELTPCEEGSSSATDISNDRTQPQSDLTTPHRSVRSAKLFSRKRRREPENCEKVEAKKDNSDVGMSMEEGLAMGKASLAKLRQRLKSEGDVDVKESVKSITRRTPLRATLQCSSPTVSPISSLNTLKRKGETVLTPSLARPSQRFSTSTPKSSTAIAATPLKRFRTMDGSTTPTTSLTKEKMKRTQSMDAAKDGSDDDSFLDDVFVPFTHPSQFVEMLKHSSTQER